MEANTPGLMKALGMRREPAILTPGDIKSCVSGTMKC